MSPPARSYSDILEQIKLADEYSKQGWETDYFQGVHAALTWMFGLSEEKPVKKPASKGVSLDTPERSE